MQQAARKKNNEAHRAGRQITLYAKITEQFKQMNNLFETTNLQT